MPSLFEKYDDRANPDPPPRVRGCETSEAAAESVAPLVGGMQRKVLDELLRLGDRGATCDELEVSLQMSHQNASARLWELRKKNPPLVRWSGEKRKTRSGRAARVYVVEKSSA